MMQSRVFKSLTIIFSHYFKKYKTTKKFNLERLIFKLEFIYIIVRIRALERDDFINKFTFFREIS